LIDALDDKALAPAAAECLKHSLLMFDAFYDVEAKSKAGNAAAKSVRFCSSPPFDRCKNIVDLENRSQLTICAV
jgi:aconitase B